MYVSPPRRLRTRSIVAILGLMATMAYTAATTGLVYAHRPVPESLDFTASAATTLFAAVAFMAWLHRARVNLDGLGVVGLRWRPGWTIGGWLIPLANLVIPPLVVREVDRASQVRATAVGRGRPSRRAVFVLWAIAWIGYLVVGVGLEYPPSASPVTVVSTALMLVAGVFAILLVRRITAYQNAAMTRPPPAQPASAGSPHALSPARPRPALPQPASQPPHAQRPAPQPPPAQVPPDAPPPDTPAVDPWPGAGYEKGSGY